MEISQQARSRKKKKEDRQSQLAYWELYRLCEVCLAEGRGRVNSVEIHEILYKSQGGKCVPDNEIAVCRNCHMRCHGLVKPRIDREYLRRIKGVEV